MPVYRIKHTRRAETEARIAGLPAGRTRRPVFPTRRSYLCLMIKQPMCVYVVILHDCYVRLLYAGNYRYLTFMFRHVHIIRADY